MPAYDANGTGITRRNTATSITAPIRARQGRHVFLGGNDLPAHWAGARVFTIVETGFGLGLNFLATWQAWRDDPARPERLHFVSVEKHPCTREGLTEAHGRHPEFAPLAGTLQAAWPLAVPGLHRLQFENGGVTLTLAFADAADAVPKMRLAADAMLTWTASRLVAIPTCGRPP